MKKLLFAVILLSTLLSTPLYAQKMRVAIMDLKGNGVSPTMAKKISELLRNEMINTGRYTIIERAQMDSILKEQGLQQTGCTDISCAVEMGKMLSARKILVGTVMKLGKMVIITGRIVDVEMGVAEFSEKGKARSVENLPEMVERYAKKLAMRISEEKGIIYSNKQKKLRTQCQVLGGISLGSLLLGSSLAGLGYYYDKEYDSEYKRTGSPIFSYDPNTIMLYMYKSNSERSDKLDELRKKSTISYGLAAGFGALSFATGIAFIVRAVQFKRSTRISAGPWRPEIFPVTYCVPDYGISREKINAGVIPLVYGFGIARRF